MLLLCVLGQVAYLSGFSFLIWEIMVIKEPTFGDVVFIT